MDDLSTDHRQSSTNPDKPIKPVSVPKKMGGWRGSANSLANLNKWKPGQSGNPGGLSVVKEIIEPEQIKQELYRAFMTVYGSKDGVICSSALLKLAKKAPIPFMRLCAQLIPKDIEIRGDHGIGETRILIVHQTAAGEQPVGQTITVKAEDAPGAQASLPVVVDASNVAPISGASNAIESVSDDVSASNSEDCDAKRT